MTGPFFDAAYVAADRPVRLLDVDPDLEAAIGDGAARQSDLTVKTIRLRRGRWDPAPELPERAFALLILEGVLVRTIRIGRQSRSELLGEGDLVCPCDAEQHSATVRFDVEWDVLERARLGVLDTALFAGAPAIGAVLTLRGIRRSHRLGLQFAIANLRRIDERLLALFTHLGDRWGRRTTEGIHVPLRLTHDLIAQLVGAQRPTVTTALSDLQRDGRLLRGPERTWTVSEAALQPIATAA